MAEGAHVHRHGHQHHPEEELDVVGYEAFGVPFTVAAPATVGSRIRPALPPGTRERPAGEDDMRFVLRRRVNSIFQVERDGESVSGSADFQIALEVLASRLREYIALRAPEFVFVHAGVVAHAGRAIVLPGPSFTGKTTLVAELVRSGATYLSDEFAVLDADGLVHPYAKPLSIRAHGVAQVDHDVATLGGRAGTGALPVGVVAVTTYGPGATWEPRRLSGGEAVLALLANAIAAQERPQEVMAAISKAVASAVVLESPRGDAAALAGDLLALAAQ